MQCYRSQVGAVFPHHDRPAETVDRSTGRGRHARRLSTFRMDALSEILSTIRLSGSVFIDAELTAPWCARTPRALDIATHIAPRAGRIIPYHLIIDGGCVVRVEGGSQLDVGAGEVICFPHGDVHELASDAAAKPEPMTTKALVALARADRISAVTYGGGGSRTRLVCGFFACDRTLSDNLIAPLPRVLKFRTACDSAATLLPGAVKSAQPRGESAAMPGTSAVLCKLSELLFIEAVRAHVDALNDPSAGWLAGLRDRHVGTALAAMHGDPGNAWTLDELASASGVSRSTLAERFARLVGETPMQYLSRWRMRLAADALMSSERAMKRIAADAGFGSTAAFSHAFKREFGVAPATWRDRRRGMHDADRCNAGVRPGCDLEAT